MTYLPDETDRKIMEALHADGRLSNREVARMVSASEASVRRRLRRLEEERLVHLSAVADLTTMGLTSTAYLRLQVRPSDVDKIVAGLAGEPQVVFITACTGSYNIIAYLAAPSRDELASIVHKTSVLPEVRDLQFLDNLKMFKHRYDVSMVSLVAR